MRRPRSPIDQAPESFSYLSSSAFTAKAGRGTRLSHREMRGDGPVGRSPVILSALN